MATLTVTPISPPSVIAFEATSQSGDAYQNDGETLPLVINASASPIIVTRLVQVQPAAPDICVDDTVSCAPGLTVLPSLTPRRFNDSGGLVQLRYPDAQAVNLTIAVLRVPASR